MSLGMGNILPSIKVLNILTETGHPFDSKAGTLDITNEELIFLIENEIDFTVKYKYKLYEDQDLIKILYFSANDIMLSRTDNGDIEYIYIEGFYFLPSLRGSSTNEKRGITFDIKRITMYYDYTMSENDAAMIYIETFGEDQFMGVTANDIWLEKEAFGPLNSTTVGDAIIELCNLLGLT